MSSLLLILGLAILAGLAWIGYRINQLTEQINSQIDTMADNLSEQLTYQNNLAQRDNQVLITSQLSDMRQDLYNTLTANRDSSDKRLQQMTATLDQSVKNMQDSNEKRLEQMRLTVEEKLEQTLQTRLQTSFETVSKQLESVNQGLGEMKTVAKDVGTLNKVLSNTKTRGIMGELQLGQIIEDILTENQFDREVPTVSGSRERVEYAVKLPGQSDELVYLPIDSKFPLEDYYRLEDAYEKGDKQEIDQHRKALLASVKRFAKDIKTKYVHPPETTNFGILFLPTEGLYAEIVRQPAFFDALRRDEHIIVAGPTTLSALLNSLQVGFKTLNLQKNADDISKVLGSVKVEFGKFGDLLTKTQKQLNTASRSIDSLLTTRTNAIVRALDTIDDYRDDKTVAVLNLPKEEVLNED